MIIDAHTHLFPDAMAERVLQKLVENTRPFVSTFGETKPHTDATVAGLTASQKKAGIDLSLVLPIATSPIVPGVLDKEQVAWLNDYHRKVFEQLAPRLTEDERAWLAEKCAAIGC